MYKVALRKNATGEIKMVEYDMPWEDHSLFMWTDGNFGCDCNRADFFGDDDPGHCSSDRFTALYAELPDGTKVKLDEEA